MHTEETPRPETNASDDPHSTPDGIEHRARNLAANITDTHPAWTAAITQSRFAPAPTIAFTANSDRTALTVRICPETSLSLRSLGRTVDHYTVTLITNGHVDMSTTKQASTLPDAFDKATQIIESRS